MDRARGSKTGSTAAAGPVSSSSLCPACNKPVDSLRAGQVAILDGAFRYFCDATCKSAYVEATSKRASLDAMTAEPPAVAVTASSPSSELASALQEKRVVASGVREQHHDEQESEGTAEPFFPVPDEQDGQDDETDAIDVTEPFDRDHDHDHDPDPEDEDEEQPPSTLRSPSVTEIEEAKAEAERAAAAATETSASDASDASNADDPDPDASTKKEQGKKLRALVARVVRASKVLLDHLVAIAPIAGVFAGVLASVVSLAGEPAGVLRLPLALAAAAVVFTQTALRPREHSEPAPWVIVVPIAMASVLATMAVIVHDPHADACASFVGLAAASALTVDILLSRARRDVLAARARTMSALAVSARVVRGDAASPLQLDASITQASQVKPGEQVVVEAGETIPVDGIITTGEAEVAPWLDSPSLVEKGEGDAVVAGAVVVSGRLHINTTFSGAERAWLRLAQSTSSRIDVAAPLVVFVRRMLQRGAPASGLLVAGAVYADNGSWIDVGLAACAGAYAISAVAGASAAALAHARGHVAAQRRGIVYKDAIAFDGAARADVAVVCSRGTILLGEPEIVAVEAITKDGVDKTDTERVLGIAAGAEMSSTHPFASAILREARARGVRPDNVRSALGHSGLGVTALAANGDRVIVGSRAFLLQEKVSVAIADARTSELEAQGRSVLLVAVGGRLVGLLALQDGLRPGARAAVQRLHDARIEPVLLSGEARDTCETIARALDIEHVRPEILPADRGAEVRALADGGRIVAALGHASTDDGALGAADVSIAMEAAGSAPGEWGVALASDDVRDAALSLTVPRACRDHARTAVIVGGLAQALGALGIAFGLAPAVVVPVLGVLTAAAVVSIVRGPPILSE